MSQPAASAMGYETEPREEIERASSRPVFRPWVDILETPGSIVLAADMPGVDESKVDITLEDRTLTIRGAVEPPEYPGFARVYAEHEPGDYERSFTLSDEIDREGIEATVRNGVLEVTLPKAKEAQARRIAVKAR